MPIAHHLIVRLQDGGALAPNIVTRRALASIVLRAGERCGLLGFGLADNHLHLLVLGALRPSALATECGRAIPLLHAAGRCARARFSAVDHLAHLANTLRYVHRQDLKHGVDQDPRREGTSLPDLLGLRVVAPWLVRRARVTLPRLRGRELVGELGVDALEERIVPSLLVDAAAAALGLSTLTGRAGPVLLARCAAVQVGSAALYDRELVELLGVSIRTVERARTVPIAPALLRAVRLQMDLQSRVPAFDPGAAFRLDGLG